MIIGRNADPVKIMTRGTKKLMVHWEEINKKVIFKTDEKSREI